MRSPPTLLSAAMLASLAVAGGGCSSSRGYSEQADMTTQSLPRRPPAGMVREPARPYGDGYSLGSSYEPPRARDYRWNGNPNRVQEGAAQPNGMPPSAPVTSANGQQTVTVRPGETLYSLSRQHGVSVAALAEQNRLPTTAIHAGQTLVLPPTAR